MGGFSALLVCDRLPVSMLVLVNAMIPRPGESSGQWWDATGQEAAMRASEAGAGRPPTRSSIRRRTFSTTCPRHWSTNRGPASGGQSDAVFASMWTPTRWQDVPTQVLIGRDDRLFPATFQRRVARKRLGITADDMPGGHLVALARPVETADRLKGYRTEVTAPAR